MTMRASTVESRSSKTAQPVPAISYRLSEKYFLDVGWTCKPNVPSAIPVVLMKAKMAKSDISPWFKRRLIVVKQKYPDKKTVFVANSNGTGQIFYPNGKLAIKIEKGGLDNHRTRIWVYSSGETEPNNSKHSSQLIGLFDSLGNGVVYDSRMKKRLVYNQKEGILWDSPNGIPIPWKWHDIQFRGSVYTMNEEEDRRKLIVEPPKRIISAPLPDIASAEKEAGKSAKQSISGSPSILSMKLTPSEIEFRNNMDHSRYLDTGKMTTDKVSPLKPIVLKINKYLALRIFSQSNISLTFFTKTHQTTLKIGILYNPFDKLKVVKIENSVLTEKVFCAFESFPANTRSMIKFKEMVQTIRAAAPS